MRNKLIRKFYIFLSLILIVVMSGTTVAAAGTKSQKPNITAPSAILVDAKSGQILYSKNAEQKRAVASTTKIMTGILTIENLSLADSIQASKRAADVGESEIYLSEGEIMKTEDILYALMLRSANDGAVALAEKVSGSVENFAKLMNWKAKKLNMNNSNFTNPHGLSNGDHYSTAKDMSILARYAMKNEQFRTVVATKKRNIPWPGKPYQRVAENYNKLIGGYPEATGVKTGFTNKAGYCLVSSAKSGNREVIAVIFGAGSSADAASQSKGLLQWGLSLSNKLVVVKNRTYANLRISEDQKIPLVAKKSKKVLISDSDKFKTYVIADKSVEPPIEAGQTVGKIGIVSENGDNLGGVPLIAKESSKTSVFDSAADFFGNVVNSILNLVRR